jgi:hypothetical protein
MEDKIMSSIRISSYISNISSNYGLNSVKVIIGELTLWFSYQTVIAFQQGWGETVITENIWGTTTGKHLNEIDPDHSIRLPNNKFEIRLQSVLAEYKLIAPVISI